MTNTCIVLVGKPEEKRTLERCRFKREDNSKMNLQEVGCEGMSYIHLAQDRGPTAGLHGNELTHFMRCEKFLDKLSD
jgi:hypothetical protein